MTHLKLFSIITFALFMAVAPVSAGAAKRPRPLVSPLILRKTINVHNCEEGSYGWHVNGPEYFGGLGWLDATWLKYKFPRFPRYMSEATVEQQAWAMAHFVAANGGWWPDQVGCTGGY